MDLAWNQLLSSKQVNQARLRPEIARAWERCLAQGLNPDGSGVIPRFNDLAEKLEENRLLVKTAARHLERLHEVLPDTGFVVMLAGADGTLLSCAGEKKMIAHADSLGLRPGADILEDSVGATALGIGLAKGRPIQVLLNEHYFRIYHGCCCSASPIFDRSGRLLGVVNATNQDIVWHPPRVLSKVKMAAEAIEAEIGYARLHDEHRRTSLYFTAALEFSPEALIVFDNQDNLTHINRRAQDFIGPDASSFVGRPAGSVIRNFGSIKNELNNGQDRVDLEFIAVGRTINLEADLNRMLNEEAETCGIIGALRNKAGGEGESELRYDFRDFIHAGKAMGRLIRQARNIASADHSLLIEGESGTGKEILAQSIHNASSRRNEPFIAVNCAALPRELIQSELFGYEKGSFTGADKSGKPGKFENAQGGTLFLDEIGDMPLEAQANFLRVLQEKKVVRIGGNRPRNLDVRVISATNKDLLSLSKTGHFRSDLYYRLAVISLRIPPLRKRPEDIWPLVRHFVQKNRDLAPGGGPMHFSPQTQDILRAYAWPGNVRELESLIIYLLSRGAGRTIQPGDLPKYFHAFASQSEAEEVADLETVEFQAIESALRKCGGNVSKAAKLLNISRSTIYKKIRKYNLAAQGAAGE